MRTIGLKEAATFLQMSPSALQQKVKYGYIPGSKPGKCWVFIEDDLVSYLRSLYSQKQQALLSGCDEEVSICHSTIAVKSGGSISGRQVDSEYAALLGLTTRKRPRNTTTG